jgi:hypothetical protein
MKYQVLQCSARACEAVTDTHSFISFTLEYNLLAMLHSFLNVNLQNLLFLCYFASFTAWTFILVTYHLTYTKKT